MNTGHYNEHIDHQNDLSDHQIIRRQLGSPFITLQTIIPSWMTSKLGRRLCSVALPPISFCHDCQLPLPQSSILSLNFQMLSLRLVGLGCSEPSCELGIVDESRKVARMISGLEEEEVEVEDTDRQVGTWM